MADRRVIANASPLIFLARAGRLDLCAQALGVPVRGTLGLVLLARQQGRIPAARPVVDPRIASAIFASPAPRIPVEYHPGTDEIARAPARLTTFGVGATFG